MAEFFPHFELLAFFLLFFLLEQLFDDELRQPTVFPEARDRSLGGESDFLSDILLGRELFSFLDLLGKLELEDFLLLPLATLSSLQWKRRLNLMANLSVALTEASLTHLGPLVLHLLAQLPELMFAHFSPSNHNHAIFGLFTGVIVVPSSDRGQVYNFISDFLNNLLDLHRIFDDFVG